MLGRAFRSDFERENVTTLYGTVADRLVTEAGRVAGVIAHRGADGEPVALTARRGVVLATGGYQSNPELAPPLPARVRRPGRPTSVSTPAGATGT